LRRKGFDFSSIAERSDRLEESGGQPEGLPRGAATQPQEVATALLGWSGGRPCPVALYMIGMVLITLCSVFLAGETVQTDLSSR
jgi:hypothetical protein